MSELLPMRELELLSLAFMSALEAWMGLLTIS